MAFVLEYLSFKFRKNLPYFFHDLSVTFKPKQLNFIQGQNGVGKSTLLRIMRGIIYPEEYVQGAIVINNRRYTLVKSNYRALQKQVSMVQQNIHTMLADQFSFVQNLQFARLPTYPSLNQLPAIGQIPSVVDRFTIDIHKPVYLLSGGQRQILAIIMALQHKANILLLDEPTAALDPENSRLVMSFLQEIAHDTQITIILISHDVELVKEYAPHYYYKLYINEQTQERKIQEMSK